ncbi:peroxiredoxin Q [Dentipellis sp. KUC8613]|nr:peroxiredoxin Q [Dentipellis sp. KUC8613]
MSLEPIDLGDSLPSVILKNEKGEDVDVSTLVATKGAIFFSIPKVDTGGCTTQACGFRDQFPDFSGQNFDVYCLSADPPTEQLKWQLKIELPYPLISDVDRTLITALGAKSPEGRTARGHFIFAPGGKLVEKQLPVTPKDSPVLALEFVKKFNEGKASL